MGKSRPPNGIHGPDISETKVICWDLKKIFVIFIFRVFLEKNFLNFDHGDNNHCLFLYYFLWF